MRDLLEARGFVQEAEHHTAGDVDGLQLACVVRNHFDCLSSWFYKGNFGRRTKSELVSLEFVESWPLTQKQWFPTNGTLWRFIWDHPNIQILRFENLMEDIEQYLAQHCLPPLTDEERVPNQRYKTRRKPQNEDGYRSLWTQDAREYVEEHYEEEMNKLGYEF